MVGRITIVSLIIYCMVISFVFAGTWIDDFEDGNLDEWALDPAVETVENGEFSIKYAGAPANMIWCSYQIIPGQEAWQDYTVECRVKLVEELVGAADVRFGISFRDTLLMWGRYTFGINADTNTAEALKAVQPNVTKPSEVPLKFTLSKDTWYKLKIIVEGDHFEFYIDGKPAGEFDDNSIPSGTVCLFAADAHVHFDDLIITGPEIPNGGSGFAVTSQSKIATMWGSIKRGR